MLSCSSFTRIFSGNCSSLSSSSMRSSCTTHMLWSQGETVLSMLCLALPLQGNLRAKHIQDLVDSAMDTWQECNA